MSTKKPNVLSKTSKSKEIKSSTRDASKEEIVTKNVPSKTNQLLPSKNKTTTSSTVKKTTTNKRNAPTTPPSTRVTKSQFFPSKTMYTSALKNADPQKITKKITKKTVETPTTSFKPKIKKVVANPPSLERPRTATLRKGSIFENIPSPETPKDDDYEDDFDSYASDFDEYQSSSSSSTISSLPDDHSSTTSSETTPIKTTRDEEKKLDSGNFDLPENKHIPILENITEKHSSLSDEGFEDAKSLQFINFMGAKQKKQRELSKKRKFKRGEELLSMIRLNNQYFELFELAPVAYDDFIKVYGKSNSYQVSTQTGDDDLDEETQTEVIKMAEKWSQFPPVFSGVGKIEAGDNQEVPKSFNDYNLTQFMNNTGRFMEEFLYESRKFRYNSCDNQSVNEITIGFNKIEAKIFEGRKVACINFCGNKLVTFHGETQVLSKSIGCVWSLQGFKKPEVIVSTYGLVTCACIDINDNQVLFAGSKDGSISVWNISRKNDDLSNLISVNDDINVIPTSCVTEVDLKSSTTIVSISSYIDDDLDKSTNVLAASKVLTLHENGVINNWSLIKKSKNSYTHLSLVKIRTISLKEKNPDLTNLSCTKMTLNPRNLNHLYVATNYGFILGSSEDSGRKNTRHVSNIESSGAVLNLEANPNFSEFFLSTYSNGNICLFKRFKANPLITMMNNRDGIVNRFVHWSPFRPCIFYTIDNRDVLHVWDLSYSEFYPSSSVPFERGIRFLEIQPRELQDNDEDQIGYMVLVNHEEEIEMHVLSKNHGPGLLEDYKMDCKKFINYVKRL